MKYFTIYLIIGTVVLNSEYSGGGNLAVKHNPTNIVHKGSKGGTTGCGANTRENSQHWTDTHSKITCDKNGCKN